MSEISIFSAIDKVTHLCSSDHSQRTEVVASEVDRCSGECRASAQMVGRLSQPERERVGLIGQVGGWKREDRR